MNKKMKLPKLSINDFAFLENQLHIDLSDLEYRIQAAEQDDLPTEARLHRSRRKHLRAIYDVIYNALYGEPKKKGGKRGR